MKIALKVLSLLRDLISVALIILLVAVQVYSIVLLTGAMDHLKPQSTQESLSAMAGFLISILLLLNGKRFLGFLDRVSQRLSS